MAAKMGLSKPVSRAAMENTMFWDLWASNGEEMVKFAAESLQNSLKVHDKTTSLKIVGPTEKSYFWKTPLCITGPGCSNSVHGLLI